MADHKMRGNDCNITLEQLRKLHKDEYILVDIRDRIAYQHGFIPEAVHIEKSQIMEGRYEFKNHKKIILYCMHGIISKEAAEYLNQKGYEAYNLEGGLQRLSDSMNYWEREIK